jgi:hypothetical protein
MRITLLVALVAAVLALVLGGIAASREPPPRSPERARSVDDAWRNSLPRDADAATRAYLERIPKE